MKKRHRNNSNSNNCRYLSFYIKTFLYVCFFIVVLNIWMKTFRYTVECRTLGAAFFIWHIKGGVFCQVCCWFPRFSACKVLRSIRQMQYIIKASFFMTTYNSGKKWCYQGERRRQIVCVPPAFVCSWCNVWTSCEASQG